MTRFLDGPAAGQHAMLKRSPRYLRVVIDPQGKVDALDQATDSPDPGERLYAYLMHGESGTIHINRSDGRGGFYALADYKLLPDQPSDAIMRQTSDWQAWVEQHYKASTSERISSTGDSNKPLDLTPKEGASACRKPFRCEGGNYDCTRPIGHTGACYREDFTT